MKLKHYQEKILKELKAYLTSLSEFNAKYEKALEFDADMAKDYNFPKRAYEQTTGRVIYHYKTNGLQEPLPDIYLKVPTGGGKTLLACHAIDNIQKNIPKKTNWFGVVDCSFNTNLSSKNCKRTCKSPATEKLFRIKVGGKNRHLHQARKRVLLA